MQIYIYVYPRDILLKIYDRHVYLRIIYEISGVNLIVLEIMRMSGIPHLYVTITYYNGNI